MLQRIKGLQKLLVLLIIGLISCIYVINTGRSICLFYNVLGIPCPGCGMTRAVLSLLKLNIRDAFLFNPLFIILFILPIVFIKNKKSINVFIITLFIAVWIMRMWSMFPNYKPMLFNRYAVIPVIIKFLKYKL